MKLPFIGQAYQNRSIPVANQRCINWYPELEPGDAREVITLQAVSGIVEFLDTAESETKAIHYAPLLDKTYAIVGLTLFEISENGLFTDLGDVTGSGPFRIKDNGESEQIGISTGDSYWVYDANLGLGLITDTGSGALAIRDIEMLDGFFILVEQGQKFFITAANDARLVDPLDFKFANGDSDPINGVLVANRRVWFLGSKGFEIWFNSPQAAAAGDFPLVRVDGGSSNAYGLAGTAAKTLQDSVPYWCGTDGRMYRGEGYAAVRISHYGIENSLRKMKKNSTITDCEAFEWTENGHRFVAFTFKAGNETWVFDPSAQMWHQRSSGVNEDIWRGVWTTEAWEKQLIGDRDSGKIGFLDLDLFTEYGENMLARRTSPVIHADEAEIFIDFIKLVFEVGTPSDTDEPQARLKWSDNGGRTFGNEVPRSLGAIGEYRTQLYWNDQGQSKNRVYDLQITDNVARQFVSAIIQAEAGEL